MLTVNFNHAYNAYMRINKRLANKIRKHSLSDMAVFMGLNSRAVPSAWLARLSIPDKHLHLVQEFTGLKIK